MYFKPSDFDLIILVREWQLEPSDARGSINISTLRSVLRKVLKKKVNPFVDAGFLLSKLGHRWLNEKLLTIISEGHLLFYITYILTFSPHSLSESVPSHWQCFPLHLASPCAWHTDSEFPSQIFLTVKFLKSIFTDTLKKGRCHGESGLSMPTVSISCLLCNDTGRAQATCQAERCPQRSRVPLVYRLSSFHIFYCHLK